LSRHCRCVYHGNHQNRGKKKKKRNLRDGAKQKGKETVEGERNLRPDGWMRVVLVLLLPLRGRGGKGELKDKLLGGKPEQGGTVW